MWRLYRRGDQWGKLPCDPRTGLAASCADPATWASFSDAVGAYQAGGYDGIGLQLRSPFVGVDLDQCRRPDTGDVTPWAQELTGALDSYTEVSPSGRGLHTIVMGTLPTGWRRIADPPIEMYDGDRFFTVTGQHVSGTPLTVHDQADSLEQLHARLGRRQSGETPVAAQTHSDGNQPHGSSTLSDEQLLNRAMTAGNGAKFHRLWHGDWCGYPSPSEADLALCAILAFWTGRDVDRIDHLFRRSQLCRAKWDRIHTADGRTYGQMTVGLAVAKVRSVWSANGPEKPA